MIESNTEEKILQSAEIEFIEKGYDGARMQGIADRAGINKALLHYYYRSKDKLFEVVFKVTARAFMPKIFKIFNDNSLDLEGKIRKFIKEYIQLIRKNPHIPMFVIHEYGKKNNRFLQVLKEMNLDLSDLRNDILKEVDAGRISHIEPEQLMVNIISLCVFPVIAKPIIQTVLFDDDESVYENFLSQRTDQIADFIFNAIRIKQ